MARPKNNPEAEVNEAAPAPSMPDKKSRTPGISVGRIVHFYEETHDLQGKRLVCWPAIILCETGPEHNLMPEEGAVDLKIFTKHGDKARAAVRFSETPKALFWSWPTKV